jgi:hypothetical protein
MLGGAQIVMQKKDTVLHGLSDDPSALEKFVSKITIFTVM